MALHLTHSAVYLVGCRGATYDQHTLYIDTQPGVSGQIVHVVGCIRQGMMFHYRHVEPHPAKWETSLWMRHIGWVAHENVGKIRGICEGIPPPAMQYFKEKLLVPPDRIRHCQHWTAEAIKVLQKKLVLEPLGLDGDGKLIRLAGRID